MSSDALHRRCVAALWRLVESAHAGGGAAIAAAASQATAAVRAAMADEPFLIVHERDGALFVDGRSLAIDVDLFQAARGLAAEMQRHAVGETLFDRGVGEADLLAWAQAFSAGEPALAAAASRVLSAPRAANESPGRRPGQRTASGQPAESRLRGVFLLHRLLGAVGDSAGPAPVVRCSLHGLVERLLEVVGGLEPVAELQRRPGALALGLRRAVAAIVLGRLAGVEDRELADLGVVALCTAGSGREQQAGAATATAGSPEARYWARCAAITAAVAESSQAEPAATVRLVRCAMALAAGEPGTDVAAGAGASASAPWAASAPWPALLAAGRTVLGAPARCRESAYS